MWCVPELDREYIRRMEDILDLLSKPVNLKEPVVALDERPVMLRDCIREGSNAAPGKIARKDYEYRRRGTANVYAIVSPKGGRHWTHATPNRKAPFFVKALRRIARAHPTARKIHLVMDNLNIHTERSLKNVLGELEARRLWKKFEVHYTPKHASWLNPAEIEISLWSRECLGRNRIGKFEKLRHRTRVWNARANGRKRTIDWRFTTADARRVFRYRRFTAHGAEH